MSFKSTRRQFLKNSAGLTGMALLSLSPASAIARVMRSGATIKLAYWNGARLVPAESLPGGDSSLESVQISVRGFGSPGTLDSIELHVLLEKQENAPFIAWVAPPQGNARTRFIAAVHPQQGLVFEVVDTRKTRTNFALTTTGGVGPKLVEGTYVLLPAGTNLSSLRFTPERPDGPLVALGLSRAPTQYVIMKIVRSN